MPPDAPHMDDIQRLFIKKWTNIEIKMKDLDTEQQAKYDQLMEDNNLNMETIQATWKAVFVELGFAEVVSDGDSNGG